mgnify:FL=1
MSRLDELKKQYPELNMSLLDIFQSLDPSGTYKYLPLICKIFGNRFNLKKIYDSSLERIRRSYEMGNKLQELGFSTEKLTQNQVVFIYSMMDFYPAGNFQALRDFIYYMEKNQIENKDVTSYSKIGRAHV